jgi:hypothetical protein
VPAVFFNRKRQREKAPARGTDFNWMLQQRQRTQVPVQEWHHVHPTQWFREAIRKLPRKWERCTDVGSEDVDISVV